MLLTFYQLTIKHIYLFILVDAISCYKCESYRDYRCLDPFDFRPHPQINCDYEPFAREKKPVFCEKVTDLSMLFILFLMSVHIFEKNFGFKGTCE